jgi:transglutaminase-like putative cysteine protease
MIEKPLDGIHIEARPHPSGKEGAMLSLDECAKRAWKARMSPRLRAWAAQQLTKHGNPKSRRGKAEAILEEFRKKVPYLADPIQGEFMATPEQTLCLDEDGLCLLAGDCDDMSIALAAIMMSIGIPAMIVGSSHREPINTPTHVFMAFEDENGDWVRMDGTTKHPVGHTAPAKQEFWVEPGKDAKDRGEGDFVGMASKEVGVAGTEDAPLNLRYPYLK